MATKSKSSSAKKNTKSSTGRSSRSMTAKKSAPKRSADTPISKSSTATSDHEEIRRWAEERGGVPACVRGTGGRGDTGMIRIDFPDGPEPSLQQISWDEWFEKFDEKNLALIHQHETARKQMSRFNKLVSRDSVVQRKSSGRQQPKARAGGSSR